MKLEGGERLVLKTLLICKGIDRLRGRRPPRLCHQDAR